MDASVTLTITFWSNPGKDIARVGLYRELTSHPSRLSVKHAYMQDANTLVLDLVIMDESILGSHQNWSLLDPKPFLLEYGLASVDAVSEKSIKSLAFSRSIKRDAGKPTSLTIETGQNEMLPLLTSSKGLSTKTATKSNESKTIITFQVSGMTCSSCVSAIENHLSQLAGVQNVSVNLLSEKCIVTVTESAAITSEKIVAEIEDLGYGAEFVSQTILMAESPVKSPNLSIGKRQQASPLKPNLDDKNEHIVLSIEGMTCASCVNSIESGLKTLKGVQNVNISLLSNRGDLIVDPSQIRLSEITQTVEDLGFETSLLSRSHLSSPTIALATSITSDLVINNTGSRLTNSDASIIEAAISSLEGIFSVQAEVKTSKISIVHDGRNIRAILQRLQTIGYASTVLHDQTQARQMQALERTKEKTYWKRMFLICLAFSLPHMLITMILMEPLEGILMRKFIGQTSWENMISLVLTTPVQFLVGRDFYVKAWKSLRHGNTTMDVLVATGTSIAYFASLFSILRGMLFPSSTMHHEDGMTSGVWTVFDTSVMLITFVTLGRYLENLAKGQTSKALTTLMSLTPDDCTLVEKRDMSEKKIPAQLLQIGDVVKVGPSDKIPCDGKIIRGHSTIDESMITGESVPVGKSINDAVIGGTINLTGVIYIQVETLGQHTMLAKIIKMVEDAQVGKAPIQALADKISGVFVPIVLSLGLATFIGWSIHLAQEGVEIPKIVSADDQDIARWAVALKLCISVIVIACPCALGLATPTAIMVGTGVGAKLGILIKSGPSLEKARNITALVVDKTGTLTSGKMAVAKVKVLHPSLKENDLIAIAALAESGSEHPLGKAIVAYHGTLESATNLENGSLVDFEAIPGAGLKATVTYRTQSNKICLGNLAWVQQNNRKLSLKDLEEVTMLQRQGFTVVAMTIDGAIAVLIAISDELKGDAREAVQAYQSLGIRVLMATGDHRATAERFASDLGISDVRAQSTPADKATLVQELQQAGYVVGMIGDGINDSPALAQADVGFTLNSGTDIAMEVADVVLMQDSLVSVATSIDLSKVIVKRIYLNFGWACFYNVIGIPLAAGLFINQGHWISPPLASAAMALSSISVICSSLLLKRYKPPSTWTRRWEPTSFFNNNGSFLSRFLPRFGNGSATRYHLSNSFPNDAAYIPLTESQLHN